MSALLIPDRPRGGKPESHNCYYHRPAKADDPLFAA
jgi:hypothetical protein